MAKKILYLIDTLGRGGAEQALLNLVPGMLRLGFDCELAYLKPPGSLVTDFERLAMPVHSLNLMHGWSIPEAVWKLSQLCRERKYDVVHSYVFFAPNALALATPFLGGTLKVAGFAGLEFERDSATSLWQSNRRRLRIYLMKNHIDGIITASYAVKNHYEQYLGRKDIEVIGYPVPQICFDIQRTTNRNEMREKLGLKDDDFLMVCPARFIPEKGHRFLIDAIHQVKSKGLNPKLFLFGAGPLREELEERVSQLELSKHVLFRAPVSQKELFPIVAWADLFVLPSLSEGYGLAIAEAMALGCPVLSTKVGGIGEIVDHDRTGVLVPPSDTQALAEQIIRFMTQKELGTRLQQTASEKAKNCFALDPIANQTATYYDFLASVKGRVLVPA